MPEVRADLLLDIAEALAAVDTLAAGLQDALVTAGEAAGAGVADALTTSTTEATESIESLGTASATTTTQTDAMGQSLVGVQAGAGLATGGVAGLASGASLLSGKAGLAASGVLILAAAAHELFLAGIDTVAAEQRWNQVMGDSAKAVAAVNVGSLNADLAELAVLMGSDDEAVMQATATIFQFAKNAGVADKDAAKFTETVAALAARAVALNPALGGVDTVMTSMSRGLATGGIRAQKFQIDLKGAEIEAHALDMTNKTLASDLSVTEKQMAGADLAAKKYGKTLGEDIAKGSKNALIQQRSLKQELNNLIEAAGKPLVMPILDLTREATPAVGAFAEVVSLLAQSALPLITAATGVLVPILSAVAGAMTAIGPEALTVVVAFLAMGKVAYALGFAFGVLQKIMIAHPLLAIAAVALTVASALGILGGGSKKAAEEQERLNGASEGYLAILKETDGIVNDQIKAKLVAALADKNAIKNANLLGVSTDTLVAAVQKEGATARLVERTYQKLIATRKNAANGMDVEASSQANLNRAQLAGEDGTVALIRAYQDFRDATGGTNAELGRAIERYQQVKAGQDSVNGAMREGELSTEAFAAAVATLSGSVAADVPTMGTALSDFASKFKAAYGDEAVPTLQQFIDGLTATTAEVSVWSTQIAAIVDAGFGGIAAIVQAEGPKAGGALAAQFLAATPEARTAMEGQVRAAAEGLATAELDLQKLGKKGAEQMLAGFQSPTKDGSQKAAGAAAVEATLAGIRTKTSALYKQGQKDARTYLDGLLNAGSPSTHLFYDAGKSFGAATTAGFGAGARGFGVAGMESARSASSSSVAGVAPAGVQVIVVQSMDEARALVPGGAQDHPVWLGGR